LDVGAVISLSSSVVTPELQFGDPPVDVGEGVADTREVLQVLAALVLTQSRASLSYNGPPSPGWVAGRWGVNVRII
jgi:hypothetical protein